MSDRKYIVAYLLAVLPAAYLLVTFPLVSP